MKKTIAILLTMMSTTAFAHNHHEGDATSHVNPAVSKSISAKKCHLTADEQAYVAAVNGGDATVALSFEEFKASRK